MCELFGMSARYPATVRLSLEEFSRHGGLSGPHKDGWGLAWYEDRELRLVKEKLPAASSPWVRFVQEHPISSTLVVSHVRKATRGAVAVHNGQPFARELGGRWHAFAHNGDVGDLADDPAFASRRFRPVGDTDSERLFCALLERLAGPWQDGTLPPLADRRRVVEDFAAALRGRGPSNFVYTDGDALFAHADRRTQADGTIRPPGLWQLSRHCPAGGRFEAPGASTTADGGEQQVQLVASVPLTTEGWQPLPQGTLWVMQHGLAVRRPPSRSADDGRNGPRTVVRTGPAVSSLRSGVVRSKSSDLRARISDRFEGA